MDILVADDERNTREALISLLQHLHHSVTAVADGRSAVEALSLRRYDLLITDLRMPGLDGDEVIAAGLNRWPGLKVLVISAYIQRSLDTLEPAQRAGLRFLIKPFRALELRRVLQDFDTPQETPP